MVSLRRFPHFRWDFFFICTQIEEKWVENMEDILWKECEPFFYTKKRTVLYDESRTFTIAYPFLRFIGCRYLFFFSYFL